ncbi:MAG: CocE/NonD family hydrolase, partial [Pseudomonadales bacterium]|nr:CocE/NonD family hydrolase [Pseudomonadales bacterium]
DYPKTITLPVEYFVASNGKKIAVSVSLPATDQGNIPNDSFPAILVQTGYNMSLMSPTAILGQGTLLGGADPYFIKRGYAMVTVDVLGTGISEGGWELLGQEEQNGYGDTIDWILQQPWSNGDIATSGASYMAITALFSAQQRPDAVKAVFAVVPLGDAQRGIVGTGGLINGVFMKTWMTLTQMLGTQNLLAKILHPQHGAQIDQSTMEHIDHIDSYYLPLVDDALNGSPYIRYDGNFWRTRSPIENINKITAPTFITGALHDIFQRDAPLLYEALQQNVDSRLAIYNSDHLMNILQASNGNDTLAPLMSLVLQWFDKHVKGIDSHTEDIPLVTQFVKNYKPKDSDSFSTTTAWPHPLAAPERWYLHGDMSLSQQSPIDAEETHVMQTPSFTEIEIGKSKGGQFLMFSVIPVDGTKCSISYRQWTLGGAGLALFPDECLFDNKDLELNALNYETELMPEDYYINGPIQADIWIESSVNEAVLSVRIDEVSPDGDTVIPLTNGLLAATSRAVDIDRSRYLDNQMIQPYHYLTEDRMSVISPGEIIKMQIEIFSTSAIIRKGHRLRVSISPSNQAQGVMNYIQQDNALNGVTTIHNSPEYPSSIVLPIVPTSELN